MEIRIPEALATAIGQKDLKPFRIDLTDFRWKGSKGVKIDLSIYGAMKLIELKTLINDHLDIKGAKIAVRDIEAWLSALKDTSSAHPRNVQHFYHMLKRFMKQVPGQRVYEQDSEAGIWWAYYMSAVSYTPEQRYSHGVSPAYCTITLHYYEFGKREEERTNFYISDIAHQTVIKSLADKGYVPETSEMRAAYLADHERFLANSDKVGRQFLARGFGTDDLDGNDKDTSSRSWWRKTTNTIALDKFGDQTRVVIDLFKEEDKDNDNNDDDERMDTWFWAREGAKKPKADKSGDIEDDEDELDIAVEDNENVRVEPEVPVHPTVAMFDLRRHLRLRVHIGQLTLYEYDPNMGEKLVLPPEQRVLIDILLAQKDGGFRDVIVGKGGGAVIICAGPPGTGKTLTAEAYAEVTSRPLYTVQCSQLGTNETELEDNLLKVFARSQRWNAILLLDEADVYVAERGSDLQQNAIVGVFLRTLEYYRGTMFMTTNRADLVDDAVLSRCIARITYRIPGAKDQARIWRILADNTGAKISDAVIGHIAHANPGLSGRDVKNLLKLSMLMSTARGEPITEKLVKEVKVFKPTMDIVKERSDV